MKKNIVKTFSFMFVAMLLAKVLGLIRAVVFANFYGTGYEATAFLTASRIPLQLLDITLGAAISSTFIPVFNEYIQKNGKQEAIEFANNFLNIIILISSSITVLGIIFAPTVVSIIAPNMDIQTSMLTIHLIKILFPIMVLTSVAFVFVGILQSLDEFKIPAIISVVSNGILILYLLLFSNKFGIEGVAVAMVIGWATQILVQIPSLIKKGFAYKFKINFRDDGIKKIIKLAIPILICSWVQPINNIINIRFASGLENGQAISALDYSYSLYLIMVGVFSYSLSNIIFPELSKLSADKSDEKYSELISGAIKITNYFVIPLSVAFVLLSPDIVKIIYERGEFTRESTVLTSTALSFYSIGMIGYGIMEILNKAFYAKQDAKTPMYVSGFAIILNVILCIILVDNIGYIGLPLSSSISSIVSGILLTFLINKKYKGIVSKQTVVELIKNIFSAMLMGIVIYLLIGNIANVFIRLVISIIAGLITYIGTTFLLKTEMTDKALEIVKNKKK